MARRKPIPTEIETEILISSGRRCCLCYGLHQDYKVKTGQIAHLDKNRENNSVGNLAFLCMEHHNQYDSVSSQAKNFTTKEVKKYRGALCSAVEGQKKVQKNKNKRTKSPRVVSADPIPVDLEFVPYYSNDFLKLGDKTNINFKFKNNTKVPVSCISYHFEGCSNGQVIANYNRHTFDLTLKANESTIFPFGLVDPSIAYFKKLAHRGIYESKISVEYRIGSSSEIKVVVGIARIIIT